MTLSLFSTHIFLLMSSQGKFILFSLTELVSFIEIADAFNATQTPCTSPECCLSKHPATAISVCSECHHKWQQYITLLKQATSLADPFSK